MEAYHDLFVASAGAAAAFIGLLFVAISLAPERIVGGSADITRHNQAQRTFIALGNIFFISLAGLIPHVGPEAFAIIALLTMAQIVVSMVQTWKKAPGIKHWRKLSLLSLATYGFESYVALGQPEHAMTLIVIIFLLYAYALLTAWDLLELRERDGGELK